MTKRKRIVVVRDDSPDFESIKQRINPDEETLIVIETRETYWPETRGRKKNINNDDELVRRAVKGLKNGTYRSALHAARMLAPESKQKVNFERYKQTGKHEEYIGTHDTITERLRRKISPAWKDHLKENA